MKLKIIFSSIFFVFYLIIYSQTFSASAFIIDEVHDMKKIESWQKLNGNGFYPGSVIQFTDYGVNFITTQEGKFHNLTFEKPFGMLVEASSISDPNFGVIPILFLKDENENIVEISYYNSQKIFNSDVGVIVVSMNSKMYFLMPETNIFKRLIEIVEDKNK